MRDKSKDIKQQIKKKVGRYIFVVLLLLLVFFIFIHFIDKLTYFNRLQSYVSEFLSFLNYPIFLFGGKGISIFSIITFGLVIFIGLWFGKIYKKFIYSFRMKNRNISRGIITMLAKIGYYFIVIIVIIISLKVIGIDLSSFTMILSALSVGIGFGLQTIVSNFMSGIILIFEQSIKEGDFIDVGTELRGTVININMRSITIRTNDNVDIVVPNQNFIENNIINRTHKDNMIRLTINFGVSYGTNIEKVEKVILNKLKESKLKYLDYGDKKPLIVMKDMGNSSVNLSLLVWTEGINLNILIITKGKFLKLIYEALNENNIIIPFPQMDLHIKDSIPLSLDINSKI